MNNFEDYVMHLTAEDLAEIFSESYSALCRWYCPMYKTCDFDAWEEDSCYRKLLNYLRTEKRGDEDI